jgi:hypothetical protein
MQFRDFNQIKDIIERGFLPYTGIELHLPCYVDETNVEEAVALVPAQWLDKFVSDVYAFDPKKEWRNTEHPWGLPPAEYSRGMAVLRRHFEASKRIRSCFPGSQ